MNIKTGYCVVYLLLLLACFGVSFSDQEKDTSVEDDEYLIRQKRNLLCYLGVNHVLKGVLHDSLTDLQSKDPMKLGNSSNDKLQDGVLQGLSTLTNESDISVDCEDDGLIFSTTLGMQQAVVHFKWKRKYLVNFDGTIWSRADLVNFDLEVKLNFTGQLRFDVTKLVVTKLEGFKFGFSGLGPINPLVKGFVKMMQKVWFTKVTKVVQNLLRKALEKQLSMLTIAF